MIPVVTNITADHWAAVVGLLTCRTDPRYLTIFTLQPTTQQYYTRPKCDILWLHP